MDENAEQLSIETIQKDNEFLKGMIDLIPPKFYFDWKKIDGALSPDEVKDEPGDGGQKRKGENELSQKSKWKRARFDPAKIKTVSQLQGAILAKDENDNSVPVKKKKEKKKPDEAVEVKSSTENLEELRLRLQTKIMAIQGKRNALGKTDKFEKRRLARKVSKTKLKMKRAEEKQKVKIDNKVAAAVNGPGSPKDGANKNGKPIFNKEGKVVYSKFDFSESGKSNKDVPKGKNYKQLLEKVTKNKEKLDNLKVSDEAKAKSLKEKAAWKAAIQKAEGIKVRDDPKLLKKSIKKQELLKRKTKKEWTDRKEKVEKKIQDKQDKRKKNIKAKKKSLIDKKINKSKKKGHIIPGF